MFRSHTCGELRIDKPLPPKADAPKPAEKKVEAPKKPAAPKPLSRLEQLRLMHKEARSAGN